MSIRGSFPSILSSTYNGDDEDEHVSPSKFNQMREQQMMADVIRADANLKAVKAFRTQNEKLYKEKELRDLRKKDILEPLSEAYTVIEVLEGKLSRRDEMIHKLRKYISVDMLKVNQESFEDTRAKIVEFNQVEEHNEMVLMDSVSALQTAVEHQNSRIDRNKITMAAQKEKIKSLSAALEAQEYNHKEQVRTIESDKFLYLNMIKGKDNIIEDLNTEKSTNRSRITTLEETLAETQAQLRKSEETAQQQAQQLQEADEEYKTLLNKYATTEDKFLECQDTLIELEERFANLRTRYEGLVTELDGMVEAGFIIPSAEELQTVRRGKRDTMKRQTSIKLTKGKSGKFRNSILGGSMTMREDSGELNGDSIGFGDEDEETKSFASPGPNASFLHANSSSKEPQNGAAQPNSKFHQRMEQEDALFNEKLFEGRAARRGDALSIELAREIATLKQQMAQQQSEHADALRAAQMTNKSLESAQMIVSSELRRLTARNQELATINNNLQEEVQEKEQRIGTLEEETNTLSSQMAAIAQQQPPEVFHIACGPDSPPATPPAHSTRNKSRKDQHHDVEDDDDQSFGQHNNDREYDNDFDVNEYMNAPPVDAATQMGASEFASAGTQFPFLDDPDFFASHQTTQTNAADVVYPTEYYLETLFRDFIEESQTHIPPHNLHVLQLSRFEESDKEKASRLGGKKSEDPNTMLEEAATFRVKRALGYLGALNDLRNKQIRYLNHTGAWNTANARMVIRCIDLVLQTTHNILCPVTMIEDSDYMELRNATDPGEATYYSDEEEEDHQVFGQLQDITKKWRRSTKGAIRKDSTFPLTETDLATDHNYGAPKGIVTHVGQVLSKAVTKYMNRAASRARRSVNVDQLLDEAEERARTASPSGRSMTARTPMTPRTSVTPSDGARRSSAPGRNIHTPGSRASSRGNSFSGAPSPGRSAPAAPSAQASPLISAFAAKVMAMATYAYGSDSSRESSPKQTSRKVSSVMPILEATHSMENAGDFDTSETIRGSDNMEPLPVYVPPPQHDAHRAASVIQGYYNFGREVPQESLEERQFNARNVRMVDLTAMDVGLHDDAMSQLKVKFKNDRSIGVSFHVKDDSSDDEEGSKLLEAFQARKHSRATAKKASIGSIGVTPGDFVDYQRLSFDPTSMENTPTFKKKSIPSIHAVLPGSPSATHRKASAGAFKAQTPTSVPHRHNSTGHYSAAVEASIRNLSQSPPRKGEAFPKTPTSFEEPAAPKPRTQSPDLLNEPKVTHFTFPDSCLETYMSNMPNEETSHHSSQLAKGSVVMQDDDENEELIAAVPFTSIAPDGQAHARSNADTPTLAEHADHLQTLLTLSSPSPTHLAEAVQPTTIHLAKSFEPTRKSSTHTAPSGSASANTTPRHKGLSGGGGLKGLLQRNIEASALAVYELQEQQRFRERPNTVHGATADQPSPRSVPVSPHLSVQAKGAGVGVSASSVRPPVHARPSSSKASVRNGRQKTKEIDWAGPAIIPVYVAPVTAAPEAFQSRASPEASVTAAEPSVGPAVALSKDKGATAVANEDTMPRVQSRKENLQLPTEGNVNLNTMLLGPHTDQPSPQPVHSQDEAVVLKTSSGNATPVITPRASHPDMAVAGQRRSNISKKEKVTNAKLFM